MKKFDDIIGYKEIVDELKRLCDILTNRNKYLALGVEIPQTLLLYGEPGVGKTLMAKALIDESGLKSFCCRKNRSDGEFVNEITDTFNKAKENRPCIVFLDDMDKFAEDNLQQNCNKEEFVTIQSCLEDIRGMDIFVLATANEIYNLPDSLLRAGRFGRQISVDRPKVDDADKIISHYLKNKPMKCNVPSLDLANILFNNSCAVLEGVINEASILAIYNGLDHIESCHVIEAVNRIVDTKYGNDSLPPNTSKLVALHEAGHCAMALLCNVSVGYVTIGATRDSYGACKTIFNPHVLTFDDIKTQVLVGLAGTASSTIFTGQNDTGAISDFQSSMDILREHISKAAYCGMEYLYEIESWDGRQSHDQVNKITIKLNSLIQEYYDECVDTLKKHRPLIEKLSQELHSKKTLLYGEILSIYNDYLANKRNK